ncbi:MAG: rubrerythrin family protein, partial [Mesorhizobium sp.]
RIPLIRREHVRGFYERKPDWLVRPLGIEHVRRQAEDMERQAYRFYVEAAKRTTDASTRKLLDWLAAAELGHENSAHELEQKHLPGEVKEEEANVEQRQFILTYVQPGLAGLMDGSVSTLA